jgi:hypothetical protein
MSEPTTAGDILGEMFGRMYFGPQGERVEIVRIGERVPVPNELRYAILCRDEFRCTWCWKGQDLQLDHVVPWSAGGLDVSTNLRLLCGSCNANRSNFSTDMLTARPKAVVLQCIRCTRTDADDTTQIEYCLTCGRFCEARRDQVRLGERYRWLPDLTWDEFRGRMSQARRAKLWPVNYTAAS